MARYVQMEGCDNCASCADIFPPEAMPGGPGGSAASATLPGGAIPEGGAGPCAPRLPWWVWLAVGVGLGWIAND